MNELRKVLAGWVRIGEVLEAPVGLGRSWQVVKVLVGQEGPSRSSRVGKVLAGQVRIGEVLAGQVSSGRSWQVG